MIFDVTINDKNGKEIVYERVVVDAEDLAPSAAVRAVYGADCGWSPVGPSWRAGRIVRRNVLRGVIASREAITDLCYARVSTTLCAWTDCNDHAVGFDADGDPCCRECKSRASATGAIE